MKRNSSGQGDFGWRFIYNFFLQRVFHHDRKMNLEKKWVRKCFKPLKILCKRRNVSRQFVEKKKIYFFVMKNFVWLAFAIYQKMYIFLGKFPERLARKIGKFFGREIPVANSSRSNYSQLKNGYHSSTAKPSLDTAFKIELPMSSFTTKYAVYCSKRVWFI